MKLLARYNSVNLILTISILVLTAIIYYQAISYILNHQVDKDIRVEKEEIFGYINQNNKLPPAVDFKDQQVIYAPANHAVKSYFIDTGFYNKKEHDYESGRALITSAQAGGNWYKILIIESKVETEDLIQIIFFITIGVILFLLLVLFISNRFILTRIWQPFYVILHQLRLFSLTDNTEIKPSDSSIDEFKELNNAVISMASRVKTDYQDLKAFTENASHELMTPIAVINSKLDSLIQTENFDPVQSKLLNDVYDAVARVTRLNQSLLLLVKIENRLVNDEQTVDLKALVHEKLNQFKELFLNKELNVVSDLSAKQITVSRYLIEVLLNNLLSNAIRHNYTKGAIRITLNDQNLIIENTGNDTALQKDDVFKRFNKSAKSEGSGLGLTISKQICDNYNYALNYGYKTPYHTFTVIF